MPYNIYYSKRLKLIPFRTFFMLIPLSPFNKGGIREIHFFKEEKLVYLLLLTLVYKGTVSRAPTLLVQSSSIEPNVIKLSYLP